MSAPVRLWLTADVHHGIDRERAGLTALLAEQLDRLAGPEDAVVLAGDLGGLDGDHLEECLAAFERPGAARSAIPGNHDLWVSRESPVDTPRRYAETFPEAARRHGYSVLDQGALRVATGGAVVAVAGTYGGYDTSLADLTPISHGGESIEEGWRTGSFAGMRWNDYRFCLDGRDGRRVPLDQTAFSRRLVAEFERQLAALQADPEVAAIVAVTHTVPLRELVEGHPLNIGRPRRVAEWFAGLAGSAALGAVIRAVPKVRLVLCGHTHHERRYTDGSGRLWVNAGCTYVRKCWYSWSLVEGLSHHGWLPRASAIE